MRAPTVVLAVLVALAFVVLLGLGAWQVQRHQWKQDIVALSAARTDAPPLTVRSADVLPPAEIDYRRVVIEGEWLVDDVQFLANRVRGNRRGEEVILPFRPVEGGPVVLVNLGWIPDGARNEVLPQLAGGGPIAGLARDITGREAHQIPSGSWTGVSAEAMSAALGYPVAGWYVLAGEERPATAYGPAAAAPTIYPASGWERFRNTTPHVEYALTWFGIAAVLVAAVVARFVVPALRGRRRTAT